MAEIVPESVAGFTRNQHLRLRVRARTARDPAEIEAVSPRFAPNAWLARSKEKAELLAAWDSARGGPGDRTSGGGST